MTCKWGASHIVVRTVVSPISAHSFHLTSYCLFLRSVFASPYQLSCWVAKDREGCVLTKKKIVKGMYGLGVCVGRRSCSYVWPSWVGGLH